MNKSVLIILVLIFVGVFYLSQSKEGSIVVQIGEVEIIAEVSDTRSEQIKGLSGRASIGKMEGMLFVFEELGRHGIWMKDMNFPIDILWLDEDKKIIHIEENVSPDTYPTVFRPDGEALYVLEVNHINNFEVGTFTNFSL